METSQVLTLVTVMTMLPMYYRYQSITLNLFTWNFNKHHAVLKLGFVIELLTVQSHDSFTLNEIKQTNKIVCNSHVKNNLYNCIISSFTGN